MGKRGVKPGDPVRVVWGVSEVSGIVTSVSGNHIHVDMTIEGADGPISGLFRPDQLLPT